MQHYFQLDNSALSHPGLKTYGNAHASSWQRIPKAELQLRMAELEAVGWETCSRKSKIILRVATATWPMSQLVTWDRNAWCQLASSNWTFRIRARGFFLNVSPNVYGEVKSMSRKHHCMGRCDTTHRTQQRFSLLFVKKLQFVFYSVNLIHIHFPWLSEQGNNIALSLFGLFCDLCPLFGESAVSISWLKHCCRFIIAP